MLKKISLIIIIISSLGIVVSQLMYLFDSSILAQKMIAGSLVGLGIGLILFGIYNILNRKRSNQEPTQKIRTQITNSILFSMSLGMLVGAVISLIFHNVMYIAIGMGIGAAIGIALSLRRKR